jgi:hypothetical protein
VASSSERAHAQHVTAPPIGVVFVLVGAILAFLGLVTYAGACGGGSSAAFYGLAVLSFGLSTIFFGLPKLFFAAGGLALVLLVYGWILFSAAGCPF